VGGATLEVRPRHRRFVVFALLTLAAVVLGRATNLAAVGLALTWPAAGIVVLWASGTRTRAERIATMLGVLAMVALGNLATGAALRVTATFGILNLIHAVTGAEVLRRLRGAAPFVLRSVTDVSAAGAAAMAAGLAGGAATLLGSRLFAELETWSSTVLVLVRNSSSTFLVLVLVAGFRAPEHLHRRGRLGEGTAMLAVTGLMCLALFGLDGAPPVAFSVLAVTAWAGLRLGVRWTALHVSVATLTAVSFTLAGRGLFGGVGTAASAALVAQAFLVVLAAVGLSIGLLHGAVVEATERERASARRLTATIEAALVGHATVSLEAGDEGRFLAVNPALGDLLGLPVEDLVGTTWTAVIAADARPLAADTLAALRRGTVRTWTGEFRHTTASGGSRWAEVSAARVDDDGPPRASVQLLDITERKALEEDLTHLALHDALTGLPNRSLLLDRLDVALAEEAREGTRTAVFFLDLDDFKHVNDSLGHRAGDLLLVAIGQRLQAAVRPGDTVSRMGGDEFVLCCPHIRHPEEATELAERILAAVEEPVALPTGAVSVGVSGGVAVSGPGDTSQDLVRRSDTAMYAAKERGRGRVEVFSDELRARATRHLRVRSGLARAVERQEIVCHYQPLVDLRTERVVGAEALVRWRPRSGPLLDPTDWLDVAEASGSIVPIGEHVLHEACRWAVEMADRGRPLPVHVNVSGRQLADSGTVDHVVAALESSGLAASQLVIELTETHLLETHRSLLRDLDALRRAGVHLSADDFGTGYSSLSHLLRLPLDQVKVDRTFVAGLLRDGRSEAIVRGLLGLAEGLELEVVAEGIESLPQAERLRDLGCPTGQGFLWSPAVAGDQPPWDGTVVAGRLRHADGPDEPAPV
jgi:diguanylate cyclase (GGDEF)-like protein/PAS domain S-box-containing protein